MAISPNLRLTGRLASFHASVSLVTGVQTPLWPLFLAAKGLDPFHIGLILSAAYIVKLVSNPLAGHASDSLGDRRLPIVVLSIVALVAFAPFESIDGFVPLLLLTLLAAGAFTALTPLGDALTFLAISGKNIQYGRVRVFGSASFAVTSAIAGPVLIGRPTIDIWIGVIAALAVLTVACWRLPEVRAAGHAGPRVRIGALLRNRVFLLFLGAATLGMSSNTVLYGFATLHWQAQGLPGGAIGALWAEMVAAEALMFVFSHRLVARFGPAWLLVASTAMGIVRWAVTGLTGDPLLLASVQWLHAFTYGVTHLAAMYFIQRSVPVELSARAQGVYAAVATGLNFGLLMPAAGWLYGRVGGGDAFLAAAALSAGGLALAIILQRRWSGGPILAPAQT